MGSWTCSAWIVLQWALQAFQLCLLATALVSWVPSLRGKWSEYISRVTEPVLAQVRRFIPPLGGFDMAFLVVFILNGWLIRQAALQAAICQLHL